MNTYLKITLNIIRKPLNETCGCFFRKTGLGILENEIEHEFANLGGIGANIFEVELPRESQCHM